jgi:DNA-binding response OmpR family regulator
MASAKPLAHRPTALVAAEPDLVDALRSLLPDIHVRGSAIDELRALDIELRPRIIVAAADPAHDALTALIGLRAAGSDARTFLLAPERAERERLDALEAGVDEALPLSLGAPEIAWRIRSLVRRSQAPPLTRLPVAGGVELDLERRQLARDGRWVHLRPKEARLLELFAREPGRALSRDHILARVWGRGFTGDRRTVDVHVRWLRQKLEPDPRRPAHLLTVRGVGYRLEPSGPLTGR